MNSRKLFAAIHVGSSLSLKGSCHFIDENYYGGY